MKNEIRDKVLAAAKASGVKNANQFGEVLAAAGIMSRSQAKYYWAGTHDTTSLKASRALNYFRGRRA